jgi:quinol monooxygenase YgiN
VLVLIGDIQAQIPRRAELEAAMLAAQSDAREQDGCISFSFAAAVGEPGHFLVVERWRDRAAMEAHFRSPSFVAYQAAITGLLARDTELRVYTVTDASLPVDSSGLDLANDE